ncbi:ATP-dependent Clp protease adaptor ClpS [Helicobacter sp. 23-1048]
MPQISQESLTEIFLEEPSLFRVLLLNDDKTTMEFVVFVLVEIFDKTSDEAIKVMLQIHKEGSGVCGIYTYDVAELKANQVVEIARQKGYPLRVEIEEII